jgi:hypothetical protein
MKDRRTAQRYDLSLPANIRAPVEKEVSSRIGKTRNLSTQGVYFTINDDLTAGAELNLTMMIPAKLTGGSDVFIQVIGTIVRVDKHSPKVDQPIGVAAVIQRYEVVRSGTPIR